MLEICDAIFIRILHAGGIKSFVLFFMLRARGLGLDPGSIVSWAFAELRSEDDVGVGFENIFFGHLPLVDF